MASVEVELLRIEAKEEHERKRFELVKAAVRSNSMNDMATDRNCKSYACSICRIANATLTEFKRTEEK